MLSRDAILKNINTIAAEVNVPELGGSVGINRLNFKETLDLTAREDCKGDDPSAQENFLLHLIIACVCNKNGKRLFKDSDFNSLKNLPATALQKIADEALRVNHLTDNAIEVATKNS